MILLKYRDEFAKRLESNQFSMDYGKYAYQELLNVKKQSLTI